MNTPQSFAAIGFEVEITGDGSPSLRLLQGHTPEVAKGESMHHSGGAAEETELIYGRVIRQVFAQVSRPHFLSVGLGLGYVEMTVARESLLKRCLNFTLESFELVPELREYLKQWLKNGDLNPEISQVYDQVLKCVLKDTTLSPQAVKSLLASKLDSQEWKMQGPLVADSKLMAQAHGLLFDAFSAKTSPDLWTEEFLIEFLNKASAENIILSTYASRGSLKRALKAADFRVETHEGFKGKRNSTMAFKGCFSPLSVVETGRPPAGTF